MRENHLLGSLSHLSLFFAPFLLPLLVWLFTEKGTFNHNEAKLALKIHILPVIITLFFFISLGGIGLFTNDATVTGTVGIPMILLVLVVDVVAAIYSLYRGIKILVA